MSICSCEQAGAIDFEVLPGDCALVQQAGQNQRVLHEASSGTGRTERVEGMVL